MKSLSSLRIVTADYYMHCPLQDVDPCYSEFRGASVKQVPVIRIFGTDPDGCKTCMHVHGVFPYLYIPCPDYTQAELDVFIYQVAICLDKAISLSLGQSNSESQHVFKIVCVKAIPFYGYHQNEHKFLKIYFYNPLFIRRAANLLQNGAILNKIHQPHESHLPYLLQFLIDFNLYGMSFLHVPAEVVRYRRRPKNEGKKEENDESNLTNQTQSIECTSVSECEIDISAAYILNRLEIFDKSNESHANPGIASIWNDERCRRSQMDGDPPPLEMPMTAQKSVKIYQPTESELFYRQALINKLQQSSDDSVSNNNEVNGDHSMDSTLVLPERTKKKFNLSAYLSQLVYPAECKNNNSESILNASHIVDHLSSESNGIKSVRKRSSNHLADSSMVDEELILNLSQRCTQNDTLSDEDKQFLEVLRKLESNDRDVDDDSILAPLSQKDEKTDVILSQKFLSQIGPQINDEQLTKAGSLYQNYLDEDDDLLNEFSMNLIDLLPQNDNLKDLTIPQLDGGSDESPKGNRLYSSSMKSKFPPLNVTITKSPKRINSVSDSVAEMLKGKPEITVCPISTSKPKYSNNVEVDQLIDLTETTSDEEDMLPTTKKIRLNSSSTDSIKIFSTSITKPNIGLNNNHDDAIEKSSLRLENGHSNLSLSESTSNQPINKIKLSPSFRKIIDASPIVKLKKISNSEGSNDHKQMTPRRYPNRVRRPPRNLFGQTPATPSSKDKQDKKDKKKPIQLEDMYDWSDCKVALEHDKKYNFFPEPGPSHINFYENVALPGYYAPLSTKDSLPSDPLNKTDEVNEFDLNFQSFYDTSTFLQSPISQTHSPEPLFNTSDLDDEPASSNTQFYVSTPILQTIKQNFLLSSAAKRKNQHGWVTAAPVTITPTQDTVIKDLINYDLPQVVSKAPFYGNFDDATNTKEVGHTILHIPNSVDCEDFESSLVSTGLNAWRRNVYANYANMDVDNKLQNKSFDDIREFFAVKKRVIIQPSKNAPTVKQAKSWLKSKRVPDQNVKKVIDVDNDSPIKVRREKAKIILENGDDDELNQCDVSLSCSPIIELSNSQALKKPIVNKNLIEVRARSKRAKLCLKSHLDELKTSLTTRESPSMFSDFADSPSPPSLASDDVTLVSENDEEIPCSQLKILRNGKTKSDKQLNGHSNKSSSSTSNSSSINALVNPSFGSSSYPKYNFNSDETKSIYSPNHSFGITGATLENTFGFKMDLENFQTAKSHLEFNYLTTMSLEVHTQTRGALYPDPQYDDIQCLFYSIQNDIPDNHPNTPRSLKGFICVKSNECDSLPVLQTKYRGLRMCITANEKELLIELVKLISIWDPDIFTGFEIEMSSWGYIIQRGYAIDINMAALLSRVTTEKINKIINTDEERDRDMDGEGDFEIKLSGRIFLNVWRLLRSEIALTSYTFENVMYHILHRRIPSHTFRDRTKMWNKDLTKWIVFEYYIERCCGNVELLNQLDLIGRTCELAKLFGIQFYEVLSRGSQYRVESMMLRIAKPRNIISVSPSVQQRAHMKAPEYLPLILEPHSRLYTDPLIVLDFQSLYPSMIIAYNYCFSTCLGRVELLGKSEPFEFGASQLRISTNLLRKLIDHDLVHISPCGAVFVKSVVREGVLPRMLREILHTRLMVKQSMKLHKNDKLLQRILHSRQLGLKLMANVTYGYTAANFSGRMPCVEVGDSVVSKGRETLERAIKLVGKKKKWESHVVYGDTDSLFVLCPGKSRENAFKIGNEIAEAVTDDNPYPVKLKLEKIYQPSILQTKKRYVGFMYESPDQEEPVYEAKGIETVRRDGCPAVAKMLEKTLKLLFETRDVSVVKKYICRQLTKILSGRTNIQDLIFAKEFRGIDGYKPNACVPALELTRKWKQLDRRAEPRRGERVPYLVVNGPPGVPLIRLVRSPHEYLADEGLKINSIYYITKVIIPPLNRCLLLIGVDVNQWFADLPRPVKSLTMTSIASTLITKTNSKKSTISQYFSTTSCVTDCGEQTQNGICVNCQRRPHQSAVILSLKVTQLERKYCMARRLCESCCGRSYQIDCNSLDCPVLFVRNAWKRENKQVEYFRELLQRQFS